MEFLKKLGIEGTNRGTSTGQHFLDSGAEETITSHTPIDDSQIANVTLTSRKQYNQDIDKAQVAFREWRMVPAPKRGEIVRQIGLELRDHKEYLGRLVNREMRNVYRETQRVVH